MRQQQTAGSWLDRSRLGTISGFLLAAFGLAGKANMTISVACLVVAWLLIVASAFYSKLLSHKGGVRRLLATIAVAVVTGGAFVGVGLWMSSGRAISPPSAKEIAEEVVKKIPTPRPLLLGRAVTFEQQVRLVQMLKSIPRSEGSRVIVMCVAGNFESCSFGKQVEHAFLAGGWKTERRAGLYGADIPRGLAIVAHDGEHPWYASDVQRAFLEIGYEAKLISDTSLPVNDLVITTGVNP